jgi:glutathione synthase/RimK-type ligase-like ATP-grasp enzyme
VPVKIAYVTYDGPDDDRDVVLAYWQGAGIEGAAVRWDDPSADWGSFDAAVVRSTWNYVDRRQEFVDWAYTTAGVTRLLNPASVLERNTDKTYLRDLAALGIPTVPTHWIGPGDEANLPSWEEYVVKPTVSAGARDTIRTSDPAEAGRHAEMIVAKGRVAMVQPYLHMVEDEGELSLLYFGGRFSHAVRRDAMLAAGTRPPRANHIGADLRDPTPDQTAIAEKVLGEIPESLLYARVDLVRLPDGTPALMELELTEPYFYLAFAPGSPERLTEALRDLL